MIAGALGEGTLVGFVGILMKNIGNDMLFYSMACFNFFIWLLAVIGIKRLKEEEKEAYGSNKEIEMKNM